jgi:flagellar basal body-associated protein FliL
MKKSAKKNKTLVAAIIAVVIVALAIIIGVAVSKCGSKKVSSTGSDIVTPEMVEEFLAMGENDD